MKRVIIPKHPNYMACPSGKIYNKGNHEIKPHLHNGYPAVWLYTNGKRVRRFVHALLGQVFLPGRGVVNHKDGNKLNSRLNNLERITQMENTQHAYEMGLAKSGEDHPWTKFTSNEIATIRHMRKQMRMTMEAIAEEMGCSASYVSRIVNNRSRKYDGHEK